MAAYVMSMMDEGKVESGQDYPNQVLGGGCAGARRFSSEIGTTQDRNKDTLR
jgi:hypothetical protein